MQVTGLPHDPCSPEEDTLNGFGTDVRVLAFLVVDDSLFGGGDGGGV